MNIKEIAQLTGTTKESIRYYESIGLLQPNRLDNGYRDYKDQDLQDIKFILHLKKMNLSLNEIGILIQLKNRETSLACKEETLNFLKLQINQIEAHISFMQTGQKVFKDIEQLVKISDGENDEEKVIPLLEKFEGELL